MAADGRVGGCAVWIAQCGSRSGRGAAWRRAPLSRTPLSWAPLSRTPLSRTRLSRTQGRQLAWAADPCVSLGLNAGPELWRRPHGGRAPSLAASNAATLQHRQERKQPLCRASRFVCFQPDSTHVYAHPRSRPALGTARRRSERGGVAGGHRRATRVGGPRAAAMSHGARGLTHVSLVRRRRGRWEPRACPGGGSRHRAP